MTGRVVIYPAEYEDSTLRWQPGRPTEPGKYWISGRGTWSGIIDIEEDFAIWLHGSMRPYNIDEIFGEDGIALRFAGPIPHPI